MTEPPKQLSLRYLFFVTTGIAVGVGLASQSGFHPGIRSIGLGVVAYWIAKVFFATSTRLPKVLREIVFLIGLPFYVAAIYVVLAGTVALVVDMYRAVFA